MDTNERMHKTEIGVQISETNLWSLKGKCGGWGLNQEFRMNTDTLLYEIIKENLLYSKKNSTQYALITSMERESEEEWADVYE